MNKKFISMITLMLASQSYAMFCPSGFNEINLGDTTDAVKKQCGNPDSEKSYTDDSGVPQEWSFFVNGGSDRYNQAPTNFKLSVTFADKKVINMTANGLSLSTTPLCNGQMLSLGSSMEDVKKACGDPVFINKGTTSSSNAGIKIIEYRYNTSPPYVLKFTNGKLSERMQQ